MQKWSIQLGEFGIHYKPRVSVKGRVLADFIVERPKEEGQDDSAKEEEPLPAQWTLFTDGSSCVDGCGAGLIAGLRIAEKIGVQSLQVNVDSKLVANQVNGTYIAKETDMIKYLEKVKTLASAFRAFFNKASSKKQKQKSRCTKQNSIYQLRISQQTGPLQANYVLREIHEGSCSMHAGTRSVVAKALSTVAMDYFTKWIEAKPVATITGSQVNKFIWENIVCRFGLPGEIIYDNGKQFRDNPFKDWNKSKTMKRPQSTGWKKSSRYFGHTDLDQVQYSNGEYRISLTYERKPCEIRYRKQRGSRVEDTGWKVRNLNGKAQYEGTEHGKG
ncbi:reverse transcriptase domain-containing protein [Tanacetum coccineum]